MKKKIKKILTIIIFSIAAVIILVTASYFGWKNWKEKHRTYSDIRIAELTGTATVVRNGEYIKLYDNMPLMERDEITLYQGTLIITIDNSTVLCLEDGTDILLRELGGDEDFSTKIFMFSGAVTGRILPVTEQPIAVNNSCCGMSTSDSIFRISSADDEHDARISVFDGEADVYVTGVGGLIAIDEVPAPMEKEAYYRADESSTSLLDDELKDIDYDTIPTQGVSYLQFLSEGTASERLKEFLAEADEELSNTYVHNNRSNGERDTLRAIGEASAVLSSVKRGDYVFFGNYDQGFAAGDEKIEWMVVDKADGKALLISRYALASGCYDADMAVRGREKLNWQTSNIREWLNTDFYESAFSDEEKAMIVCGADGVSDDNVFLLSESDAMQYFNGKIVNKEYDISDPVNCNARLVSYPCELASVPGSKKGSCNWLLRTYSENGKVMIINEYGAIAPADPEDYMGILPAIYVEYSESTGDMR